VVRDSAHAFAPLFVGSDVYRRSAYGQNHPLAIARVEAAVDLCRMLGWLEGSWRESPVASREELEKFHRADYIDALRDAELIPKALLPDSWGIPPTQFC